MVVTQVIAGLAQSDGGPSYSVPALSAGLSDLGIDVRLRCLLDVRNTCGSSGHGFNVMAHPTDPGPHNILKASRALRATLERDAREGSLLHAHGIWLMPNLYPAWIKRDRPETLIMHSPRGMLAPAALDISRWRKKLVWLLWQKSALQRADCIHATAVSEYEEIRAIGLKNPVTIIPNGIDVPPLTNRQLGSNTKSHRTILSLGRLHPKKALDVLIRAWAQLEPHYPDWRVRIVGPSEAGHDEELKRLAKSLGTVRLTIEGGVYGAEKFATYRDADVFALPSRNENFGIAVAEALAAEVPVISTKGAPWSGLELERCGWWIDHGVEPLATVLRIAMETERREMMDMGQRGRAWMERDFGWKGVATEMAAVYAWLRKEAPMPKSVRID
jgi:glycosyltransferase involved in cell wall biosynthesis